MKSMILCDGKLLVVGDGDFSFTLALVKHCDVDHHQVFTSNLETETSILHHAQASDNMRSLKDLGVSVFLETDATDLHNHPVINKESFDRIIFNFPLADRHNIKKNRSLLADFFSSCRSVLAPGGRVMVTLCKGQGGTPADQPIRSWHDSWQIVAMATNASFLLREVLQFDPLEFPEYHSVGFRFQDKSFNVKGALTHVFEEGAMVEDKDFNIRGVVCRDGQPYSCSSYVASHLNRNLLEEPRNPIYGLRQRIMEKLGNCPSVKNLTIENECSPIIPSHKSNVYFCIEEADIPEPATTSQPDKMAEKDWKNCENLKRMAKSQLAHGVLPDKSEVKTEHLGCVENATTAFLPSDRDNVYILVKSKDSVGTAVAGIHKEGMEFDSGRTVEDGSSYSDSHDKGDGSSKDRSFSQESPINTTGNAAECSPPIYHCRTSLLENLPHLCHVLNDKKEMRTSEGRNNFSSLPMDVDAKESLPTTNSSFSTTNQSDSNEAPGIPCHATSYPCLVVSGQSMLPCHITPSSAPIKHEALILHQINNSGMLNENDDTSLHEEYSASNHINQSHFDHISSQMYSLLHSLGDSISPNVSFTPLPTDSSSYKVGIDGVDESYLIGQITIANSNLGNATNPNQNSSDCVGLILQAKMEDCFFHITILDLQRLLCHLCKIDDWRLLWSHSDKFFNQFQSETTNFSLCQYSPFSLFPMKFVHDLSFWEREQDADDDSTTDFDEFGLYEAIRSVVGDLVINVSLMDVYQNRETMRRSRCYRLHFLSSDKCLSYVTSWKMQSKIRMEVARILGVQLR